VTSLEEDTEPALGGYLDLNGQGFKATFLAAEALVPGDLCYLNVSGTMGKADASGAATCKTLLGIALTAAGSGAEADFLLNGYYSTSGLTAGDVLYVSETAGAIVNAPPLAGTTGAVVRPIGTALTTTSLYFNPDRTWMVLS
jgi:hypothetical protein